MDWSKFSPFENSKQQSFETLCDQLFESWCLRNFKENVESITPFDGSGGDGGVESIVILADGSEIGLQAKWFPTSLGSGQIAQIRNSIVTAKENRPNLIYYIVAIPRNLAPTRGNVTTSENTRWLNLLSEMHEKYPDLKIALWNKARLDEELLDIKNGKISRFWFEKSEICEEAVENAFEKSKAGWLSTKYLPELNVPGYISKEIKAKLGNEQIRNEYLQKISRFLESSQKIFSIVDELLQLFKSDPSLEKKLSDDSTREKIVGIRTRLYSVQEDAKIAKKWLENGNGKTPKFSQSVARFDFYYEAEDASKFSHGFVCTEFFQMLSRQCAIIDGLDFQSLINSIAFFGNAEPLLILGDPGTGKTQGVAAVSEALINENIHTPILIPANDFDHKESWREILLKTLGEGLDWDEESLLGGLMSLAYRKKRCLIVKDRKTRTVPKILIIVDALDESTDIDTWKNRIKESKIISEKYPLIQFCFTARPWVFSREEITKINKLMLPATGDADFDLIFPKYLDAYKIRTKNIDHLKSVINTPFTLRLLCDLYKNRAVDMDKNGSSIGHLIKRRVEELEKSFAKKEGGSEADQFVFKCFLKLAPLFSKNKNPTHDEIVSTLIKDTALTPQLAGKILDFFKENGIVGFQQKEGKNPLALTEFSYFPGPQSYFDYAEAINIINFYKAPENINFDELNDIHWDTIEDLALLAMENFDYLLARNESLYTKLDAEQLILLASLGLREAKNDIAKESENTIRTLMKTNAHYLRIITNFLIIPLAHQTNHPLGTKLLDSFLNSFATPALRDEIWSIPDDLYGSPYSTGSKLLIKETCYSLSKEDAFDSYPLIFAWALSSLDNNDRKFYRTSLLRWGKMAPKEFFKLFTHFFSVNDPQIRSDMTALLMCVVFEDPSRSILQESASWITTHVLAPDKRDENRDVAVRYYSLAIVKEAIRLHIIPDNEATCFLPPYIIDNANIDLDKDATDNATTDGYKSLSYDLLRYVLADHVTRVFSDYENSTREKLKQLFGRIEKDQPSQKNLNLTRLTLSFSYKYLLQMGWSDEQFCGYDKEKRSPKGIDSWILHEHRPADHGSQSEVMTIHEKYLWQARRAILGFLADRLPCVSDCPNEPITDYGLTDSFIIPSEENNLMSNRTFVHLMPEIASLSPQIGEEKKEDVIRLVTHIKNLDWSKWLFQKNEKHERSLPAKDLVVLSHYSTFGEETNIQTSLWINSFVISKKDVSRFISKIKGIKNKAWLEINRWKGAVRAECYVTPYEICWSPWKKRDEYGDLLDYFPDCKISSAVDTCVSNVTGLGDISYELPSKPLRDLLHITSFDGSRYLTEGQTPIILTEMSRKYEIDYQESLWADKKILFSSLETRGKTLIFCLEEEQRNSSLSEDRFGQFRAGTDVLFIAYFEKKKFHVVPVFSTVEEK